MLPSFYTTYFAKDKPYRHFTQHLLVAVCGYLILSSANLLTINATTAFLFLIFTYLPDLDGVFSVLLSSKHQKESHEIVRLVIAGKWNQALTMATLHHKKFNRLIIHNVIGGTILLVIFLFFTAIPNHIGLIITGAMVSHFVFDILDDLYQLGHINNWLWPVKRFSYGS